MKIAYITNSFPEKSEVFAASDMRQLVKLGHELQVFALKRKPSRAEELMRRFETTDIRVDYYRWIDVFVGAWLLLRHPVATGLILRALFTKWQSLDQFVKTLWKLPRSMVIARTISQTKFDVVHLFWGNFPSIVLLCANAANWRLPKAKTMFLGAYDLRAKHPWSRIASERCAAVVTHVAANQPAIVGLGIEGGKITVIHRGIDTGRLKRSARGKKNTVVMAGRLIRAKGFDIGIRVFAEVAKKHPEVTLKIFGDGPEKAALKALVKSLGINNRVQFLTSAYQKDLFDELCRARLFLHPSHEDHLPNVVKEAIWAGCYCVVGASLGIRELITSKDIGKIINFSDKSAPKLVSSALHHRGDQGGSEQLTLIKEKFDAATQMSKYLDLWEKSYLNG